MNPLHLALLRRHRNGSWHVLRRDVAHDIVGFRNILAELGHAQTAGTLLLCDNQAALAITKEQSVLRSASKHLDMRVLKIRELESQAFISAQHCHTRELWADLFTKNLSSVLFVKFRDGITGYTRDLAIGYEQHEASVLFISVYQTSPARIA